MGVKLVDQQVEQLRKAADERTNSDAQASRTGNTAAGSSNGYSQSRQQPLMQSQDPQASNEFVMEGSVADSTTVRFSADPRRRENSSMKHSVLAYSLGGSASQAQDIPEVDGEDGDMMDHNNEKFLDADMEEKQEIENNNKFTLSNLNLKKNNKSHHSKEEIKEDNTVEVSELEQKTKTINATAKKRQSVLVFSSLAVILVLSSYFVIAYFLAMNTFQAASEVVPALQTIFQRGTCLDTTINYLREDEIHNQTLTILGT